MNLDNNPTKEQLAELLRQYDDRAGHHVLWVDRHGYVHVSKLEKTWPPPEPGAEILDNALVRFETFRAGNGYVGPNAATSEEWLTDAFEWLSREWGVAKESGKSVMIEV